MAPIRSFHAAHQSRFAFGAVFLSFALFGLPALPQGVISEGVGFGVLTGGGAHLFHLRWCLALVVYSG